MKKLSFVLILILVASAFTACGGDNTEPKETVTENKSEVVVNNTEDTNTNKREIEEAKEQPELWIAFDEFLTVQKQIESSRSLDTVSDIKAIWARIEAAKESWAQNPFPFLTKDSVETVYQDFLSGAPSSNECQYAINGLLFRGADFDTINQLHMLKDNPMEFVEKYNQMRESY
ncbi:MAG TPA: hypothetical protein PKV16_05095 [Caldisericia bacterium]|nr:hypothetical protein [Caldisericia bacterium]HPF48689.1 hypothetical protein [Caldisericia bacterium]HPI83651.1 hypothetical protein [Caldisericia bacterium]HPQ93144.1 hypothetical protein [Caldisericia bacterium]HRV75023.1 hypothetical protein [Caldisericia bacterium]